ncbi:MAG: hypothetical protein EXS03_01465 [Phycisphaerales bacterium]|nr:hypothetical protein [Phycisphaerales bacterium]
MTTVAPRSSVRRASTEDTVAARIAEVRRAYFAVASCHAHWRIGVDTVVALAGCDRPRWKRPADLWMEDLLVAAACLKGNQEAWHHLELANSWRLREAAQLRLSPGRSAMFVARFWLDLKRNSRAGGGVPSLTDYCGEELLSRWLVARLFARLECTSKSPRSHAILDSAESWRTLPPDAAETIRVPTAT